MYNLNFIPKQALLSTKRFRFLLNYEFRRKSNEALLSDVFDTPVWRAVMGQRTKMLRIRLLYCAD